MAAAEVDDGTCPARLLGSKHDKVALERLVRARENCGRIARRNGCDERLNKVVIRAAMAAEATAGRRTSHIVDSRFPRQKVAVQDAALSVALQLAAHAKDTRVPLAHFFRVGAAMKREHRWVEWQQRGRGVHARASEVRMRYVCITSLVYVRARKRLRT